MCNGSIELCLPAPLFYNATMSKKKKKPHDNTIAQNKKARHDYKIDQRFEAGVVLEGWEVKSLREGAVQLTDSYVDFRKGEAWLLGLRISPLLSASTHVVPDASRMRKLLLNKREIAKIFASVNQKGYTCVALALYWKGNHIKCEIALAKGKKEYDKRATEKERDWGREKQRIARDR